MKLHALPIGSKYKHHENGLHYVENENDSDKVHDDYTEDKHVDDQDYDEDNHYTEDTYVKD